MKEISIIVPVYNVEKYLQICIESIIAQTFTDFELILIDDGSTDNSAAICDEYAKQDDRICVIHKENQGVGAARNQGLDICTGKYICFIDSDDYIEKDYLEYLYNRINVSEYDFVSCCANFVDENNNFIMKNEYSKSEFSIEKENIFDIYMHTNFIEDVAWNKIYRSTVFENLRYVEGIIYEDSELIIRLLKQVNKVLFTNKLKYNYRIRSGSILNYNGPNVAKKIFTYKKLDLLKVYELIYFELKETQYEKKYIKKILSSCSELWKSSMYAEKDLKIAARQEIKKYYNRYKKYLFDKEIFSVKERWFIIFSIKFGKLFWWLKEIL